jgi:hypothetical protein
MANARFDFRRFIVLVLPLVMLPADNAGAGSLFGGDRLTKYTNHPGFRWQTIATKHFTIYHETNSATVPRLEEMQRSITASRAAVLQLIRCDDFPDRLHVFLVDSRARMKDLMGVEQFGGAIASIRVVFAVVNATNNGCSTHEFCHVIASATWGKPERWIDEGFASYSDERWRNRDTIVAQLAAQQRLLPLKTLTEDFLKQPEWVTYHQSASFLGYVIERHGWEKFKQIWRGGFKSISRVLGRSLNELEAEWRATLPQVEQQPSDEVGRAAPRTPNVKDATPARTEQRALPTPVKR